MKKGSKDFPKIVEEKAKELLSMLSISADVSVEKTTQDSFNVSIESQDASLLIGYHGENLEAFQLILSLMANHESSEFKRIVVNVGDYRERREEKLKELAQRAKQEALEKNGEVVLPNLSSSDRRIIHLFLQEDGEVSSESKGEGRDRQLVIKPKAT